MRNETGGNVVLRRERYTKSKEKTDAKISGRCQQNDLVCGNHRPQRSTKKKGDAQ